MREIRIWEAKQKGQQFAKFRTTADCFYAVTEGNHICTDSSCSLTNRYFYESCMDNARSSAIFCDSLPLFHNFIGLELWKKDQCDLLDREDKRCGQIYIKALQICDK